MPVLAWLACALALLGGGWRPAGAYDILGIFPQVYRSHSLIYNPIMVELARRGHNVTVYSVFQAASRLPNLRQVDLRPCFPKRPLYDSIEAMRCPTALQLLDLIYVELPPYWNVSACPPLAALLRDSPRFDALLTQPFNSDLFSAYARRLRIPTAVYLFTSSLHTWLLERLGSPSNPSYIPERGSSFVRPMDFWERVQNAYRYAVSELYYRLYFAAESERIYRAVLGDGDGRGPSLSSIAAETGLVLANTHFSLYPAAPLAPAVVEVAGVNLKNASALPPVSLPLTVHPHRTDRVPSRPVPSRHVLRHPPGPSLLPASFFSTFFNYDNIFIIAYAALCSSSSPSGFGFSFDGIFASQIIE